MNKLSFKERFGLKRFFSGEKPSGDSVELNQQRTFILPTPRGLGFALLLLILLLIAFIYGNNLVYLLTFLLASIFFITILHTFTALSGLIVKQGKSVPVFLGEPAGFEVLIENTGPKKRQHILITLKETESLTIDPHSLTHIMLYSMTHKRGWHKAGTITLASTFPLGLFRAWSPIRFNFKTLVYPKPADMETPFPESPAITARQGHNKRGMKIILDYRAIKQEIR